MTISDARAATGAGITCLPLSLCNEIDSEGVSISGRDRMFYRLPCGPLVRSQSVRFSASQSNDGRARVYIVLRQSPSVVLRCI